MSGFNEVETGHIRISGMCLAEDYNNTLITKMVYATIVKIKCYRQ